MKKVVFSIVVLITVNCFISNAFAQNEDILAQANQFYSERKFKEAEIAYKKLLEVVSDHSTRAKIIYNLGMTYQQLTDYKKAIETFGLIFSMDVHDKEPGGNLMQPYRNYRHSAQWEIGNSYFAMEDFENALKSFQIAKEKYPFQSWCGTCQASVETRYYETIAICFENLGRYEEAVKLYLKISHPRVLEIYEFNGQLDDIKKIIAEKEEPQIIEMQKKYAWTREFARKRLPTKMFDEFFEVYEMEKNKNISGLMNLAAKNSRNGGYYADILSKMLARHPQEVIPQVEIALKKTDYSYLYYRILGYIASPESAKILVQEGKEVVNSNDAMALVEAVNLSGEVAVKTFSELSQEKISENMRWAIDRNTDQKNKATNIKKFPELKKTGLPASL